MKYEIINKGNCRNRVDTIVMRICKCPYHVLCLFLWNIFTFTIVVITILIITMLTADSSILSIVCYNPLF